MQHVAFTAVSCSLAHTKEMRMDFKRNNSVSPSIFFFLYFLRSARRKLEICVSEYQYDSYRIRTAFLCARVLSLRRLAERYDRSSDICFPLCDFTSLLATPPLNTGCILSTKTLRLFHNRGICVAGCWKETEQGVGLRVAQRFTRLGKYRPSIESQKYVRFESSVRSVMFWVTHCVNWDKIRNVSEEYTASIFRETRRLLVGLL